MKRINLTLLACALLGILGAQKAPDFTITDYNNTQHKLYEDYLDEGTIVMLKIMFVACPPCRSQAPAIQNLYEDYGEGSEGVEFFDLSNKSWDDNAAVKGFANTFGLTFTGAGHDGGALTAVGPYLAGTWGRFRGTPTYVVIAPDGTVHFDVGLSNIKKTIDDIKNGGGGGGGGGGGCANAFEGEVTAESESVEIWLDSDVIGATRYDLNPGPLGDKVYAYNCEFVFPPQAYDYYITAQYDGDEAVDGLTVGDIVTTLRHLLALKPFETTEEKIAADFTANGVVSARDLSEARKLALGRVSDNIYHDSWIFWSADQDFSTDSSGTLIPDLEVKVPVMDVVMDIKSGNFKGVKLGDTNGSINKFFKGPAKTRGGSTNISIEDQWIEKGESFTLALKAPFDIDLFGLQGTVLHPKASLLDISVDNDWEVNFEQFDNRFSFMTYGAETYSFGSSEDIVTFKFSAEASGWLSNLVTFEYQKTTPNLLLFDDLSDGSYEVRFSNDHPRVNVFPNPTRNLIQFESNLTIEEIQFFDLAGNLVEISNRASTSIGHLPDGLYLISIQLEDGSIHHERVIKN